MKYPDIIFRQIYKSDKTTESCVTHISSLVAPYHATRKTKIRIFNMTEIYFGKNILKAKHKTKR